jgi:hypothetical protein
MSDDVDELLRQFEEVSKRAKTRAAGNKLKYMYPDEGQFPRKAYRKHTSFFKALT